MRGGGIMALWGSDPLIQKQHFTPVLLVSEGERGVDPSEKGWGYGLMGYSHPEAAFHAYAFSKE